jgi:hypothetical protein
MKTLDKTIILDPSFNPDFASFSTWVNSNKSANLVTDPNDHSMKLVRSF